jgi:hypothetical protein
VLIVLKSGSLNLLEPSGPDQSCNGIALSFTSERKNVTLRRVHTTTVAVEKQKNITYSECVSVALGIQHALRMRHIVICGLPFSTVTIHIIS